MAKVRTPSSSPVQQKRRTAIDPEAREMQLVARAYDLAEQRIMDGTASSQEIIHFLRIGSSKHKKEMDKLMGENELLRAKVEALESGKQYNVLVEDAIRAMREYSGQGDPEDYDEY